MTEELKQAAQQAPKTKELVEQLRNIANGVRICGVDDRRFVAGRLDEIAEALTQRPAAQAERECPHCNYTGSAHCGDVADKLKASGGDPKDCSNAKVYGLRAATPEPSRGMIGMGAHALANELAQAVAQDDADPDGHDMSAGLFGPNVSAWLRKISADYLPQHATPEPVGEAVAWRYKIPTHGGGTAWTHTRPQPECLIEAQPLYTHPAPGVPDGLPAVLTDWGFDVHDDEEGRTWLTIRNPDDDVARMSVPTVWPLNGNQTIGAVVLHQFSAALTSALAAAQAKGADHD